MNELEIIHHRRIDGLSIFFNTVDYRTPHTHPERELIWVLDNSLSVTCGSEQYLVNPGEMMLFNPNEPHEFHKEKDVCTFLCLQLSPAILPAQPELFVDKKLIHQYLSEQEMSILKNYLTDIIMSYTYQNNHWALVCVGNACLVFHLLFNKLPSHMLTQSELENISVKNARLDRLIQFVDENYMHKIRLSDFARQEGCSMSYLSRFIKTTLNQTFQQYVTSIRFNCACKLISAGDRRLLDVCMESGFSDYRYFSREFRRQYNMTPEEYSHYADHQKLVSASVSRSLHSIEYIYSQAENKSLIDRFCVKSSDAHPLCAYGNSN